jgi:hypothetical protein
MHLDDAQRRVCAQFEAQPALPQAGSKVGIALSTLSLLPLNALRIPTVGLDDSTNGWYIWGGEVFSEAPDFFDALHVEHLSEYCPAILEYLGLPPGWRVLLAPNQTDVWFDDGLLAPRP